MNSEEKENCICESGQKIYWILDNETWKGRLEEKLKEAKYCPECGREL